MDCTLPEEEEEEEEIWYKLFQHKWQNMKFIITEYKKVPILFEKVEINGILGPNPK